MGRKIVLLSDGTGNSSAKVWRTNVWRIFECLNLSGDDQVAFYDDGVGTASFKPLAILGGAFGYGLKRNVIDIYKFACRNYREDDDEIYGFGFSRGAFTMRVVVGLIVDQGLLDPNLSEADLHQKATEAYRAYRKKFHTKWPRFLRPENYVRWIRDLFSKYSNVGNRKRVNIRFLGLWDTVAAYGMPIEEMARGLSQWIWPWMLPRCDLDTSVKRACHALSVDDERTTFHPVLWDERKEKPLTARKGGKRYLSKERISQVWFPGVHSNVGGGYPDDSVALIPLIWILSEAQACGLRFKSLPAASPQTYKHPATAQDKDGRIYDPRKGLGGYYRYGPRDILALGRELLARQDGEPLARIHESVLQRIANRAHFYAPIGLPQRYEIVTSKGQVLSPEENPYETPTAAKARWNLQEKIWNIVWLRRLVYFLTVAVSIALFAFPLMKAANVADEYETSLRWLSDIIRAAGAFLPSGASPWLNGYARNPALFVVLAILLALMLYWGSRLADRIQNRMGLVWRDVVEKRLTTAEKPSDIIYRFRTHPAYTRVHRFVKISLVPALSAVAFVWLGVSLLSHGLFNLQDDAGLFCKEGEGKIAELKKGDILLTDGNSAEAFGYLKNRRELLKELQANDQTQKLSPELVEYLQNKIQNDPLTGAERTELLHSVTNLPTFQTKELCQSLKVKLEKNATYRIRFESTTEFKDDEIPAAGGFYTLEAPLLKIPIMFFGLPLRRELIRPWFRVVARYGGKGGEENFLDPDESVAKDKTITYVIDQTIKPTRDGELFLFVNDAVIGAPGLYKYFYQNNKGSTKVLLVQQ